jgi:hypothetical protein
VLPIGRVRGREAGAFGVAEESKLRPTTGRMGQLEVEGGGGWDDSARRRSFTGSRVEPLLFSSSDALSIAADTAVGTSPQPGGTYMEAPQEERGCNKGNLTAAGSV